LRLTSTYLDVVPKALSLTATEKSTPPSTLHLDVIAIVASSSRIAVEGEGEGEVEVEVQVDVNRAVRLSQGPDPFVRRLLSRVPALCSTPLEPRPPSRARRRSRIDRQTTARPP